MSSLPYDVARLVSLARHLNPDCPTIGAGYMAQLKDAADRVHATITGDHHAKGTQDCQMAGERLAAGVDRAPLHRAD